MAESSGREDPSGTGFRNRKSPRIDINLSVIVRVLIEEATFSPYHLRGTCRDISLSGALVEVEDLTHQTYATLIKRQRYIRLICGIPGREQPLMLFGRIVWYDYQAETDNASMCKMGIAFETMKEEILSVLREYIDAVGAQESDVANSSQ
jgi:c-di-GMP-binding flagellar brake protein YcgR